MGNISLQIERSASGNVEAGEAVIFDTIISSDGNISYDPLTGIITFNESGRYIVNWWVATQGAMTLSGAAFALSSSQLDFIEGSSASKIGQITGFGMIKVNVAPVSLSLINASTGTILYSSAPPSKAMLFVSLDGGLADTSLCFITAQYTHIIKQLLALYPTSVMSVFTTNTGTITGTPYQVYTSPEANDGGLFILINSLGQYETIPLMAITAIYIGADTVYNPSITYLPAPAPLPPGCDTNLMTAIHDYLPVPTEVIIYVGPLTQASGEIYRNEYGVIVLSDADGNTPIFIPVNQIARIITNPPELNKTNVKPVIKNLTDIES